jgi:sec-independent protein translocase protein TatA
LSGSAAHLQSSNAPEPHGTTHDREHPQPHYLLLILVVALIVLGPKRLPEAGRELGSAIRGFRDSLSTAERREEQPAIQPSRDPDHTPGAQP